VLQIYSTYAHKRQLISFSRILCKFASNLGKQNKIQTWKKETKKQFSLSKSKSNMKRASWLITRHTKSIWSMPFLIENKRGMKVIKKSRQSFAQCSLLFQNTYIISLYKGINQIGFKDFSRAFFNRDNSQGLFGLQNHFALEFRAEKGYGGR